MENNINDLCRICSNLGQFNLFAPIPAFLHENSSENLLFQCSISKLISELTDLTIGKNDGLPQKICELCISYLKHAVFFRQQARKNTLNLIKANNLKIDDKNENSDNFNNHLFLRNDIIIKKNTNIFSYNKIYNKDNVCLISKNNIENNDDNKIKNTQLNNSDILCLNELSNVVNNENKVIKHFDIKKTLITTNTATTVPTPEIFREHKCCYCNRRYMSVDSYNLHLEECIQKKLTNFVWKLNYVMNLKETKKIRPNTFIRLMITNLKEALITLGQFCDYFPDILPCNLITETNQKEELLRRLDYVLNIIEDGDINIINKRNDHKYFMNLNEIINKSESQSSTPQIILPQIRCSECEINFDSLDGLEIHNFKFHNTKKLTINNDSHTTILELFENQDGRVDVTTVHSDNLTLNEFPLPPIIKKASIINQNNHTKFAKCSICAKEFLTIRHLDEHKIKFH